ncbi:MAG: two-component regulator propeller domain-containing protein [Dokdonella sp.]
MVLAMLGMTFVASAAVTTAPPPLRDYAVDRWTTADGLSHNSIRGMAQSTDGYLWFGSWEGVVRYNGQEFVVFDRASGTGLLDNGIGALYRDPAGGLWLGDSRGNVGRREKDGSFRFWPRPNDVPEVLIHSMSMDRQGRLWLVYEGKGLSYLDADGEYHHFPMSADSPMRMANFRMVIDAHDRIWIGSYAGLVYQDIAGDGIAHRAPDSFKLPAGLSWPYQAPDGTLWIAAEDSLFRMVNGTPQLKIKIPDKGRLTAMLEDHNGQLWLGTENLGLFRLTERYGLERMQSNLELPGGRITEILEDTEGSIWVGTNGGLFRLRETLFSNHGRQDGLSADYIRTVMEDRNGRLWIGSSGGLDRMDADGSIKSLPLISASGNAVSVLSLAEDANSSMWVGTYADGVYRVDADDTTQHFGKANGLPPGNIRSIAVDAEGVIWLGTQLGVARLQGDQARMLDGENAPLVLTTALESQPGELWIGSIEGARVLRGTHIERIELADLGGARTVFGFRRLGSDMWIASDRGLYRYREGKLAHVGLEKGMPVDAVFEMLPDRSGNIWITSNRGVLRTKQAALDAVADGRSARIEVSRYNEMDGMNSAQANGGTNPAAWLRRDNTLWIATALGLTSVDPKRLEHLVVYPSPPTVIERIGVEGQPLSLASLDQPISLPGGKRLTVSYVGISYLLPKRIVYRTRLEGLEDAWVERGQQRSVEFFGLPPGDYGLHIAAAHPGEAWSSNEALWRFHIEPFWWQRISVRIAAALIALLALLALYRYLIARYRDSNLKLMRLVDTRTQDLQQQTQRLLLADEEKSTLLEQIREQSVAFEKQAREDALTGLPNRRAFDEAMVQAVERARSGNRPLTLAMIDVDHFKEVNDQHSHSIGDAVLREVGRLLSGASRASDVPARVGGEEFALLFNDTTLEQAQVTCERLRQRFHEQRNWAGVAGVQINFSAGLVQLKGEPESGEAMLQRADDALYRAKQEGRDRICIG